MQFIALAAQQARIRSRIDARIKAVLDHGKYIMGPEVAELEELFCTFTGSRHCITCASGTDALLMPLEEGQMRQVGAALREALA
ncbi:DegT/DnrJ/EryC1/StrS family aminotransferase [Desulfovibrio sp. ZJ369]|uniref:DegT/DnrJ/EryC1/StrS family aminotransferase n=1 Tax=Desulfovibrio sp. ZJ369 TaxID=2709793 RepID=UPI0013EC4248|nr:DegT/DnrJ/EryC1/StrS family aminotransferase [Desulfovibrio sp. ZJ369]